MLRYLFIASLALGSSSAVSDARAQSTVECQSRHYQYGECWAGPLSKPQLIHQTSGSPCILNRTWGYNPRSKYIWVAQGCSGIFADVGGYHHGRGDTFDPNARMYDHRGHDVGAVVGGAILGALIEGMADSSHNRRHTTSNYRRDDGYNGCHGVGCMVDNPDEVIDTRPQFDRHGEPNFDVHGNYQGCHGAGCLVDDPGDAE
ncbi:DUF3011 domain-containing protein [Brucella anthropi]|uniref:DUF3011 domain-containing protein n=1 Tax=Brucella anthropi TaxID=529 RepID=UPI00124EB441|nr:DUF3011 domain-containing protein [Brucella anthropi]KAB2726468.1 DUF3011 domain-containing protein [Brucella anthropi]KAB2743630.1 DUF3011 domain-containing protein [Brucella anthropi]KAB2804377.1 DUF3011 domain-containing protein [Brucella anthropi]